MNISARNLLSGKVSALKPGAVNSEVELTLSGNSKVIAVITNESVSELGLVMGSEAFAIVKAPLVIVTKGKPDMKFSTRNVMEGTVINIKLGAVNAEVSLELPGGNKLHSVITLESAQRMSLQKGDIATALFKASSVILAVRI